jgi:superfamily IV 4 TMS phage holin
VSTPPLTIGFSYRTLDPRGPRDQANVYTLHRDTTALIRPGDLLPRGLLPRCASMRTFLIRLLVNAVALGVAALVVDGISLDSDTTGGKILTLLIVAAIFGLVNAIIKPHTQAVHNPALRPDSRLDHIRVRRPHAVAHRRDLERHGAALLGGRVLVRVLRSLGYQLCELDPQRAPAGLAPRADGVPTRIVSGYRRRLWFVKACRW